jgi:predicted ATPase with chaperone activity
MARTIADLEDSPGVLPIHVEEALRYRPPVTA